MEIGILGNVNEGIIEDKASSNEYNNFAEEYSNRKKTTIENFLCCGKILCEAKDKFGHGMFLRWLSDPRVSESEKTAQRLMSIYKNFFHILQDDRKLRLLTHLGISHLLELQKLPDRFKKEIEVIKVDKINGVEEKEIVKVMDEDKLVDFLEQKISVDGEEKTIGELPLKDMKRFINEASGIYAPDIDSAITGDDDGNNEYGVSLETKKIKGSEVTEKDNFDFNLVIEDLLSKFSNLMNNMDKIDETYVFDLNESSKEKLKTNLTMLGGVCEGFIVKKNSKEGLL